MLFRRVLVVFVVTLCGTAFATSNLVDNPVSCNEKLRIGIVGAGIGGTATSWFLRERLGTSAEIVIFERERIGGRVHSAQLDGHLYEAGASIFHDKNKLIRRFARLFGLETPSADDNDEKSAIYRGSELLFRSTGWKMWDVPRALLRYGLSPLKISSWTNDKVDKFCGVYKLLDRNCSYPIPIDLILASDPSADRLVNSGLKDILIEDGLRENFVDEIVATAMRVNYNQGTDVPAFVGSISLAGMEGPTFRVKGGNVLVADGLSKTADKVVISAVTSIEAPQNTSGRFMLTMADQSVLDFDYVVLAAPFRRDSNQLKFINFPAYFDVNTWMGAYQRTVTTLVNGVLNTSFIGETVNLDSFYDVKLDDSIASISRISDVDGDTKLPVYKIFSRAPVETAHLNEMFTEVRDSKEIDWRAYPDYMQPPKQIPPFELWGRLYHLNGIEWMGSAMEMSLVAAQNVAMAIYSAITGITADCPVLQKRNSDEL